MTVRTQTLSTTLVPTLLKTTAGALALALLAQARIPLPFTPVPITLQVLGVLLLGGLLGPWGGAAAVVEYLLFGACGLPVFSGHTSAYYLLSGQQAASQFATIGYLLGFVPAAVVVGAVSGRCRQRPYASQLFHGVLAGVLATLIFYLGGWAWLAFVCRTGMMTAILLGILPFVVGDLLKIAVAAAALAMRRGTGGTGCPE